jgi:hypothetical protein
VAGALPSGTWRVTDVSQVEQCMKLVCTVSHGGLRVAALFHVEHCMYINWCVPVGTGHVTDVYKLGQDMWLVCTRLCNIVCSWRVLSGHCM